MRKNQKKRALPQGGKQLRLRAADRRRLIRWGERTGCPHTLRRCLAVAKVAAGQSRAKAARELLCATSTVVAAVGRDLERGREGLVDRRALNGQRKVDERFRQTLCRVLGGTPQQSGWRRTTWTRELLARELERRGRVRVSPATMGRALASVGARLKRPRPVVRCPWPARQRQQRLWQLKCRATYARPDEPVFYEDEMDVHLNPKLGPDWMLPGQRARWKLRAAIRSATWPERSTRAKLVTPSKPPARCCAPALLGAQHETVRESRTLV